MTERSAENELSMFTHKQDGYRFEAAHESLIKILLAIIEH